LGIVHRGNVVSDVSIGTRNIHTPWGRCCI